MYETSFGPKWMISGDNKFTECNQGVRNILLASLEDMEETADFLISYKAEFSYATSFRPN